MSSILLDIDSINSIDSIDSIDSIESILLDISCCTTPVYNQLTIPAASDSIHNNSCRIRCVERIDAPLHRNRN